MRIAKMHIVMRLLAWLWLVAVVTAATPSLAQTEGPPPLDYVAVRMISPCRRG